MTSPEEADLHRPVYSVDLLAHALNQTPSRPLLRQRDGGHLTIGEVRDATSRYVQALATLGVKRGSRVALLSGNRPEVLHTTHAVQLLAGIYVPMHSLGSLDDHSNIIQDATIELLVFDAKGFGSRATDLARITPGLKLASFGPCAGAIDLDALAQTMTPCPLVAPRVSADEVARIGYSGGTTGKAKSIGGTHGVSTAAMSIVMAEWEWPNPPHVLCAAPLSHAGATLVLPTLLRGGTMLVLPGFEPVAVMSAIQDFKLNCTLMVPTMIYALLDHPRFKEFDLSSLETVFYGGSSISPTRLKEAIERIGPVFSQFYGQAEAPMVVTLLRKHEHDVANMQRLASCGRPLPWSHVALLDSSNRPVPDGEPGEICVRGSLVMTGYRNNPELTAETFAGGWLHTGDVAVRDADGFLRIVDRKKDMIVSGGFNIFPRELEDILVTHPAVAQAAVFGLPDPKWGEAVTAAIVLRPGQDVAEEDLRALVANRKGSYQAPKRVVFVDVIPQTPVGKPDKKTLRARFLATDKPEPAAKNA
jgi:fatty-acyl-CoA synthase